MNKIQKLAVGQMIAFNYTDKYGTKTLRVATIIEITTKGALCWCMTELNRTKFLYSGMEDMVIIGDLGEPKQVDVGKIVYIIVHNTIKEVVITRVAIDADGFLYTVVPTIGEKDPVYIKNPEHFNTTKTACANEWLRVQGLPELPKAV